MKKRLAAIAALLMVLGRIAAALPASVAVAVPAHVAAHAISLRHAHAAEDPNRRDEYGLKPDDGGDKELSLPDPVLDRSWPETKEGQGVPVAPDEDETDPFQDEDAPPPPAKKPGPQAVPPVPRVPPPPLVGPDGKLDAGSPAPEPDPEVPAPDEPEPGEPSEIDDEDRNASPLDRDDAEFRNETSDPGEW